MTLITCLFFVLVWFVWLCILAVEGCGLPKVLTRVCLWFRNKHSLWEQTPLITQVLGPKLPGFPAYACQQVWKWHFSNNFIKSKAGSINNSLLTCEPAGKRLQGPPGGYGVVLLVVHPVLYHASLCIFSIKFFLWNDYENTYRFNWVLVTFYGKNYFYAIHF